MDLKTYTHQDAAAIRGMLLDMQDAVYDGEADRFRARERFAQFVDMWSSKEGWSCVIGFDEGEPTGFAYGAPFGAGGWWKGSARPTSVAPEASVFALSELKVLKKWRKTGASEELHRALVLTRDEGVATLLVDVTHPKVVSLYERWGYVKVGEQKPYEDSPTFAIMAKHLTAGT
ncbi:GNAT family N-acetyltransferase [Streptomyces alboflavus]|uniref:GNAT family N-acetyltransferase n=1 Tax=Streptomyces alboflavus TaxID=67267 RepID=UPI000F656F4D|nr:GNAT family N-acetyltransferase [Streptomyces alboflavus]